jgi:hypothetical protein
VVKEVTVKTLDRGRRLKAFFNRAGSIAFQQVPGYSLKSVPLRLSLGRGVISPSNEGSDSHTLERDPYGHV